MEPAELACALASTGLDVLMWAGLEEQRAAVRRAGLELAPGVAGHPDVHPPLEEGTP